MTAPDQSFCFVHADFLKPKSWSIMGLLDALFDGHPRTGFTFITFTTETMAHLMHKAGAFTSVGNARRNGWNDPMPPGFSHYVVGKRKISIAVLNLFDGMYDHACELTVCRCGTGRGINNICHAEFWISDG
jgi:hypothetical protein